MKARVVCAFAEFAHGPGWANTPVYVILRDGNGKLSMECLQPEEQTREMDTLYKISNDVHLQMAEAATAALNKRKSK